MRHDAAVSTGLPYPPRYGVLWSYPPGRALIGWKAIAAHGLPSKSWVRAVTKGKLGFGFGFGFAWNVDFKPPPLEGQIEPAPITFRTATAATRLAKSRAFRRGVVNGFAPESYLLRPWSCPHHLVQGDTIGYSWDVVGKCLERALIGFDGSLPHEPEEAGNDTAIDNASDSGAEWLNHSGRGATD
jgi:hypothetical protein